MPAVGSLGLGGPVSEYGIEGVGATHTLFGAQVAKHPRLQALVAAGRKSVLATKFSLESHHGGVSGSGMVVASVPSKADSVITAGYVCPFHPIIHFSYALVFLSSLPFPVSLLLIKLCFTLTDLALQRHAYRQLH